MSFDLYLWKAPVTDDPDEAGAMLNRHLTSGKTLFESSAAIAKVSAELQRRHPWRELSNEETLAAMSDEDRQRFTPEELKELRDFTGGKPFAIFPFDETDRLLVLNLRWGPDSDAVLDDIIQLGLEHDLVIYDPQGPSVYLPSDPDDSEAGQSAPPIGISGFVKMAGMLLLIVGFTYSAWRIPWPWLRWPLFGIGLFLTAAALFAAYATIAAFAEGQGDRAES